ncbi:hypothetical protein M2R47_08895 [Moraxella sp. Tifton1]|uniref:hypothetical protein n=1 Tax=Moraxella oculi TaxID=2940516 RepID=UPI002013A875|nr:hypothetical protein [Moraxella sp. Tifton1]MCL1624349.1 hypothetical protein [Moraxella sp. Tifton1]
MKIEIVFSNEHPAQDDNLFRLGYLKVTEGSKEIYFFKDKICMIFLTLDSLAEFLFSKSKHCRWVGEDSGMVYSIKKHKDNLIFSRGGFIYKCSEFEFIKALFRVITNLAIYN